MKIVNLLMPSQNFVFTMQTQDALYNFLPPWLYLWFPPIRPLGHSEVQSPDPFLFLFLLVLLLFSFCFCHFHIYQCQSGDLAPTKIKPNIELWFKKKKILKLKIIKGTIIVYSPGHRHFFKDFIHII